MTTRVSSIKCLSCNAAVTRTTDGNYTCVECGRSPLTSRSNATDGGTNVSNALPTDRPTLQGIHRYGERTEFPAVGLVATTENTGDIATRTLRAMDEGHAVFVTHRGDPDVPGVLVAAQLGAYVVDPAEPHPDSETLKQELLITAKAFSYPGLIYHPSPRLPIDYERSVEMLETAETYSVEATVDVSEQVANVLVAIPAYNEAETIGDVVSEANEYADAVLVIDDGSVDATPDNAREADARVVEHERNAGYGGALKTAFEKAARANVDHLVVLDGDGQHDPSDIPKLVGAQRETNADVVIGSRFTADSETRLPLYRRFGLIVVNLLTNVGLKTETRIRDTQSGFRVYNQRAVESLASDSTLGDHMDASIDILYHVYRRGYAITEVGTTIDYDVADASSHNPVRHGLVLVRKLLQTIEQDRPIMSLGVPGFLSTIVGFGFGYWTFSVYIQSGTFPKGLAITSVFFTLAGIFSCFTAIILHSLNRHADS